MSHPIHPAIVHFPIASWTLSTIGDIASIWLGEPAWKISGVLLIIGTVTAIGAMISGFFELRKINPASDSERTADMHMQLVLVAWMLYTTGLVMRFAGSRLAAPGWIEILLSGLGLIVLLAAGWFGGKLVYEHGAGVLKQ